MKVKLLDPHLTVTLQDPKMTLQGGQIYDLNEQTAKRLIESNLVVAVEETEVTHENQDA